MNIIDDRLNYYKRLKETQLDCLKRTLTHVSENTDLRAGEKVVFLNPYKVAIVDQVIMGFNDSLAEENGGAFIYLDDGTGPYTVNQIFSQI